MRTIVRWILRGLQLVLLAVPAVLQYYGTHTMGVHRHLVYRGQYYAAGILSSAHLAAAAVVTFVLLAAFPLISYRLSGKKPESLRTFPFLSAELFLAALLMLLALPACRAFLVYPYLLLCAALICLLQFLKLPLAAHDSKPQCRGSEKGQ